MSETSHVIPQTGGDVDIAIAWALANKDVDISSLNPIQCFKTLASSSDLPENPTEKEKGTGFVIDGDLWLWDTAVGEWTDVGQLKGEDGNPGTYIDPANIEIFSDLDDLSGKTTAQKEAMMPDGNAVEAMLLEEVEVNVAAYPIRNCSLGIPNWYMSGTKGRHKAIPVSGGDRLRIITTTYFGWLTSEYDPDDNPESGDPVPYVSGTSRMYAQGGDEVVTAPSGAAYLCLTVVDGSGTSYTNEVYFLERTTDVLSDRIDEVVDNGTYHSKADTNLPLTGFYIDTTNYTWKSSDSYKCKLLDVRDYKGKGVTIAVGSSTPCRYAFLRTDNASNNSMPDYCTGSGLVEVAAADSPVKAVVPDDACFMYLYASSGGTDVTPVVTFEEAALDFVVESVNKKDIDVDSLALKTCSLLASTNGWYLNSDTPVQRHSAIPVEEGEQYYLTCLSNNASGTCYYGLLTSSYNPATTYANGDSIPYVSGTDRNSISRGKSVEIIIPSGCAYLALNRVDGGGNTTLWALEKYTFGQDVKDLLEDVPLKFRIAHWNVGHFALGASYDTTVTHSTYDARRAPVAKTINGISADIFMCCEYNTNFVNADSDNAAITARDALFTPYKFAYVGSKPSATSYMQTAIFMNRMLKNVKEVVYPNTVQAGRYYQVGEFTIGNKTVKVVETHLDFNSGEHGHDYRQLQIQKLIDDFADDEYVIIGGDFNTNNCTSVSPQEDEYAPFRAAGYDMVNWGYLGYLDTMCTAGFSALDNILAKGFRVDGIHLAGDDTMSDHFCIYADFTLLENTDGEVPTVPHNNVHADAKPEVLEEKENKVTVATISGTTLSAEAGKYYVGSSVGTLAVTLPTMTDATKVASVVLNIATGSSPAVTFTAATGVTISYSKDFSLDASTEYEVNCLWNGTKWIIMAVEVETPS